MQLGRVAQDGARFADVVAPHGYRELVAVEFGALDGFAVPRQQACHFRPVLQLCEVGESLVRGHAYALLPSTVTGIAGGDTVGCCRSRIAEGTCTDEDLAAQSRAPFFHTYHNPAITIPMYTIISIKPNIFSSLKMTAQG